MAGKLYWRIKKNGKWTWTAAETALPPRGKWMPVVPLTEEE